MKPKIGISEKNVEKATSILSAVLANEILKRAVRNITMPVLLIFLLN